MIKAREDIIAVCAGLARLQLRLMNAKLKASRSERRLLNEVQPASPWLDATPPGASIIKVVEAIALAQAHSLAMLDFHAD